MCFFFVFFVINTVSTGFCVGAEITAQWTNIMRCCWCCHICWRKKSGIVSVCTCCCGLCIPQQPLEPAEADRVTNLVVSALTEMNDEWLDPFSSLTPQTWSRAAQCCRTRQHCPHTLNKCLQSTIYIVLGLIDFFFWCFWKKSLMLTKAAFIWFKLQLKR